MPLQASCPKCHKRYQVSDNFVGRTVLCKACRTSFTIPAGGDVPLDLAPTKAVDPGPRPPRLSQRPPPREDTAEAAVSRRIALDIPGALGLLLFLAMLLLGTGALVMPALRDVAYWTLIPAGLVLIYIGSSDIRRVGREDEDPMSGLILRLVFWRVFPVGRILLSPVYFFLACNDVLRDQSTYQSYKRPLFWQICGFILIALIASVAMLDSQQTIADRDRLMAEHLQQLRARAQTAASQAVEALPASTTPAHAARPGFAPTIPGVVTNSEGGR